MLWFTCQMRKGVTSNSIYFSQYGVEIQFIQLWITFAIQMKWLTIGVQIFMNRHPICWLILWRLVLAISDCCFRIWSIILMFRWSTPIESCYKKNTCWIIACDASIWPWILDVHLNWYILSSEPWFIIIKFFLTVCLFFAFGLVSVSCHIHGKKIGFVWVNLD